MNNTQTINILSHNTFNITIDADGLVKIVLAIAVVLIL